MKKNLRIVAAGFLMNIAVVGATFAQTNNVGIGTTKPASSAILDLTATDKGLLIPRMTAAQVKAIPAPVSGLLVFQTDGVAGFQYFDGTQWSALASPAGANSVAAGTAWDLTGNLGTDPAANYIGTGDQKPVIIKANNERVGFFDASGYYNLFLGNSSGISTTPSGTIGNTGSGTVNTGIGAFALQSNTTGTQNIAIGYNALNSNSIGYSNLALGTAALLKNTVGSANVALGISALFQNINGNDNIGIGAESLFENKAGYGNISIGRSAGRNATGSSNIFIGSQAGYNETANNTLYISSSSTPNPLIKGDFANNYLKINVGATSSATTGFLAIGDFGAVIPMSTVGGYRLIVQDGILTEKLKVAVKNTGDWADYVFEPNYKCMSLEDVEKFINKNKHLPNTPSAIDMTINGLDVINTSAKMMEKIEELTLYVIELNKKIKKMELKTKNIHNKQF